MLHPKVEIEGKRYVLVEESEFRRLERRRRSEPSGEGPPPLPEPDEQGYVPALDFARVSLARGIVRERKALRLTQQQLAELSGVRQETICRLEKGLHSPTVRTVDKIDRALKRAAARKRK